MINPQIIDNVRLKKPLIHLLTNQVVMNFSANGVLSFGAAPVMAKAIEEAADMADIADALVINIGTILSSDVDAMILAGQHANNKGIPVIFDPVGVAATKFRTHAAQKILKAVKPTVIKGNAGEMAHLVNIPWETKGVESVGAGNTEVVAAKVAEAYETTAVVTGKTDIFYTNNILHSNQTGHPLLTKVTGAGCLLGAILAACLTTEHEIEEQIQTALSFYGLAAEYAGSHSNVNGTGTFISYFLDALSLDSKQLEGKNNGYAN